MNFCSLDEAWGTPMDNLQETNNKTYSNFETNLKNNHNQQIDNNINIHNQMKNNNPLQNNNTDKQLVLVNQNDRNIVSTSNPNQLMDRKHLAINSIDKVLENIERRIQALEGNNNGSNKLSSFMNSNYLEYIIIIVIAVVGVYFLDKYLNGTSSKLI